MPFLTNDAVTALSGTEDRLANTPLNPPQPQDTPAAPSIGETYAAGFHLGNNATMAAIDRITNPDSSAPAVPGYDAALDIHGYENQSDRFLRSTSPAQTQVIKDRIDAENAAQSTIARSGGLGTAASIAGSLLDPATIASYALMPELAGPRIARFGAGLAVGAAAGEAQQYAINKIQGTDYTPNALRIGGNALLFGVLGSIAPHVPASEFDPLAARVGAEINRPPSESTAGAQQVTAADTTIAKGGVAVAKTLGQTSPMMRILANSDNTAARELAMQLTETPAMTTGNMQGVASASSIETVAQQARDVRDFNVSQAIDKGLADLKAKGTPMSRDEFKQGVADAMRNSDQHEIPQIAEVASKIRPIFSSDRAALAKLGELPEGLEVLGAPSYLPRVYNARAIIQDRAGLENALFDHFTENPKIGEDGLPVQREPGEVKDAVHGAMDNILGTVRGTADFGAVKNPSSMKARSLDVPDSVLSPWLSHDIEHVMHGYNRSILPKIEMMQRFGTTDLQSLLGKTQDEFHRMLEGAPSAAGKEKITTQHNATLRDLEELHSRVLEQAGARNDPAHMLVRVSRLTMTYNYLRELGGAPLSAIPDIARMIGRYGLGNTTAKFAKFIQTDFLRTGGPMRTDAHRLGTAFDTALHTRAKSLGELASEPGGSRPEQWASNIANKFTRGTLMAPYDEALRTVTASLEQDAIHAAVMNQRLSAVQRGKLASVGIGDAELPAIRAMWNEHGSEEGGLNRARTELWSDQNSAKIVEQAVVRAASRMAFHIGKGDLPLMMSNPLVQMMLQFKSFALTAPGRVLMPLTQGVAHGDFKAVQGIGSMLALGGMAYYMKEIAAGNNKPDLSPMRLAGEMVDKSGLLGYVPDLYSTLAPMAGLPTSSRYSNRTLSEALVGPAMGSVVRLGETIHHMRTAGASAADIHTLRTMLPLQNVWYLRRLIDGVEGKVADLTNAKGATHQSFAQHVLEDRTTGTPGAPKQP